jgi:peptidoglycan/LPS O-acetylase OafA/YrhL
MNRLEPLTGLRGIAAYSVLIAHTIASAFSYDGSILQPFASRLAYFGMSLFFVLSGFVIYYNYAESFAREPLGRATWKFFVARFARLYPLYAMSIIVALPYLPAEGLSDDLAVVLAYLTLTQAWFNLEMAVFPPDWSISAEWFFYLAFIPLGAAVRKVRWPLQVLVVYSVLALLVVLLVFHWFEAPLREMGKQWLYVNSRVSSDSWGWLIYFSPPLRLLEFIAGMLSARTLMNFGARGGAPRHTSVILAGALLWCALVVFVGPLTRGTPVNFILSNVIFAPALALFILHICFSDGWLSTMLSSRALQFMGDISFSVYVWSFFVMDRIISTDFRLKAWSLEAAANAIGRIAIVIGLTTVFAYGSYLLIEMPARRWIRAALRRREAGVGVLAER